MFLFFFNDTATTEIYTLSLHDALPISRARAPPDALARRRRARPRAHGAVADRPEDPVKSDMRTAAGTRDGMQGDLRNGAGSRNGTECVLEDAAGSHLVSGHPPGWRASRTPRGMRRAMRDGAGAHLGQATYRVALGARPPLQ